MTGPFSARRRAEEFDAADVLAVRSPSGTPSSSPSCSPSCATCAPSRESDAAARVRRRPARAPDGRGRHRPGPPGSPPAHAPTKQRLVLPAAAHAPATVGSPTLLGGAALVGATTSMAVAAQTALPGESLYPVKRAHRERPDRPRPRRRRQGPGAARQRRAVGSTRSATSPSAAARPAPVPSSRPLDDLQRPGRRGLRRAARRRTPRPATRQVIPTLRSLHRLEHGPPLRRWRRCVPDSARDELVAAGRDARRHRRAGQRPRARRAVAASRRSRPTCSPPSAQAPRRRQRADASTP